MQSEFRWQKLLRTAGVDNSFTPGITYDTFTTSCTLFAVDMSYDELSSASAPPESAGRMGKPNSFCSVRHLSKFIPLTEIHLEFESPLSEALHLRVAGLFADKIAVSKGQRVTLSYIPSNW